MKGHARRGGQQVNKVTVATEDSAAGRCRRGPLIGDRAAGCG